jgi:hypothetical protein
MTPTKVPLLPPPQNRVFFKKQSCNPVFRREHQSRTSAMAWDKQGGISDFNFGIKG